jgi:hypothetical protein
MVQIDTSAWEGQATLWSRQSDLAHASGRKIDVHRAIGRLPAPLREVAQDLQQSLTVKEICGRRGKSRPRIYQMMRQIRSSFAHSGLVPNASTKAAQRGTPKKK